MGLEERLEALVRCSGGVYGQHRSEPCLEEPFLHALFDDESHDFCCTKHVSVLKYMRILDFNGKPQVHEVTPECLIPESVWDIEENCCVLEEEDDEPELSILKARYTHRFH